MRIDFTDPSMIASFEPVHDAVMGGISSGTFTATPAGATFAGALSLEHGGGFASVRAGPAAWDASGARHFRLRLRGDGRTYKLTLRTEDRFNSPQYQAAFVAPDEWQTVTLPIGDFRASFRGRSVPDAPELDPAGIRIVGLLIADRRAGPFKLEIASIETTSG